jgi:hypothetical protein
MINLEGLELYPSVGRFDSTYIDGIQLYNQFLIYMTQLNKFPFYIKIVVYNRQLPSNEDIQRSFIERGYQQCNFIFSSWIISMRWRMPFLFTSV